MRQFESKYKKAYTDKVDMFKDVAINFINRFMGRFQIVIRVNRSKVYTDDDGLLIMGFLKKIKGNNSKFGRPKKLHNGWSNNEIAKAIGLSVSTVGKYFRNEKSKTMLYESSRKKIEEFIKKKK
jgi:hypothetical protein